MKFGSTTVTLKRGDITCEQVDAIVNAANTGLRGGGGVDGAIHRAGGPVIMEECEAIRAMQGGCPTGEAVATTAGDLMAKVVIHAVGPVWRGGSKGEEDQLRSAYLNSLRVAVAKGAKTVAFPSISTGVYGYPIETASRVAAAAVKEYCLAHEGSIEEVRFILFSDDDLTQYEKTISKMEN